MKISTTIFNCSVMAVALSGLVSCGSKESESTGVAKPEAAEITWEWKEYRQSNELTLQSLPVEVQPKQSLEIKSEAAGILTLEIDKKQKHVTKDEKFARMDVDTLSEQGERLQIQEEKRVLEDMRAEKLELPEKRKAAKEELKEARRKVRLMEMILKNPAMKKMSAELGLEIGAVNKSALNEAKDTLSLAEQKVAWAEEFDDKLRNGDLRLKEMDSSKNKRSYEDAKERSVYKAPFVGELRLEVDFVEGQSEYTVAARETIATLNDYSEIRGQLKVGNASWVSISPQRLYLSLNDKADTVMPFLEDEIIKDRRTQKEERHYLFSVPLENNESLKRLVGTQMKGKLVYKLPKACFIVPKYNLSLYALGKSESIEWEQMVTDLWPGAKVLAEGLSEIAISYQP